MNQFDRNLKTVDRFLRAPYWNNEYDNLFSDDIVIEMPSAPPGMPQYLPPFEVKEYRMWMRRTVKSWNTEIEVLTGTPDPNLFFTEGYCHGEVFWGNRDGVFDSRFIAKIQTRNGKIVRVKQMLDPLSFLRAAGRELPIFRQDLYDPRVDELMAQRQEEPQEEQPLDTSPSACRRRLEDNLAMHMSGNFRESSKWACFAPEFEKKVWFLPEEMKSGYPKELLPRVIAWADLSSVICGDTAPFFDCDGRTYATLDPNLYYAEYSVYGSSDWIGNNCPGMYRNQYFHVFRFDDLGRITMHEEYLNPVNKFNSINVSLPTFPYFL